MKKLNVNWNQWGSRFIFWMSIIIATLIILNYQIVLNHLGRFLHILAPFVIGFIFAYLLSGLQNRFKILLEKIPLPAIQSASHPLSIVVLYLSILFLLFIMLSYLIPLIIKNINDLIAAMPQIQESVIRYVQELEERGILRQIPFERFLSELTKKFSTENFSANWLQVVSSLGGLTINLSSFVLNSFLSIVVSIYVLIYKDSIVNFVSLVSQKLMSKTVFENSKRWIHTTHVVFYKFISSQFLDACVIWILSTIILSLFQVKYAITLGLLLGICNMIPYFGAIFASLVTGVVTLFTGGLSKAITILLALLILQQIDGNVIGPRIMGGALNINPIIIIVSITIGGAYFGIVGMFLAVPIAAIIKIMVSEWLAA